MQQIDDRRFLRKFCWFVAWRSRFLDGCPIFVTNHATDPAGLTIVISNGVVAILQIAWTPKGATLLPGATLLSPDDLWGLEEALTYHVERFLRRHRLIDMHRRSTRRHTA